MSTCANCNYQNPSGIKFCGECGAPLNTAQPPYSHRPIPPISHPGQPNLHAVPATVSMRPANPGQLAIGTVVDGKYTIESQLGEGGMGIVYFARDIYLETPVVIKGIRPELAKNKEFRARILAEGKAMAKIDHENVVRLNSVVVQPDELFLVMQYVDGESLDKTIARYASQQSLMPLDRVFQLFDQILAGVGAAHDKGMIHRDIKPANILISRVDSKVKVTDFGIAKAEDAALAGKGLTRTDGLIGSVLYMSPEQIQGERNLDRRVDIYSLGIMLFEMLAGRVPFDGPTAYTTMNMHVREPIPSITLIRPDVPDYVREVIERACAKSRDLRFGSAADMAVALRPGSVVVSAGPDQLPVAPVFPGGATVAQSPFASIASESAGIVPEPQRALSPTEIAMVGGLPAAGVRKTPPSVDPPSQEQGSAKGATEIAVDVDSAVVRVPAMAPKTPTPLLDPPPQDQVSAKGSTVIASKDELAAARGEASPRKKLHVPAHDSSKPPVVRPKPAPAPKAAVTIDAAGGAKSARHLPQKTESGDDGGNPIVSSILEMLLANRALLIPIIAAIVLVPLGIYKAGQPWCSSSETKCGDVCCDNSTELCGFETCHRRCLISGSVYPVGFENPANNCQVCSDSTLNWESRPEGTECGNGKYCNAQSSCIDGCVIDGKVYPRAISCGDGEACHAAAYCDNACVIDGKAYPRGTPNPSNPCQLCLSANPKGWTSAPKGSPCRGSHGVNYQETACDGSGRCGSATISVSVGNNFTCGVTSAGAAKCWGVNDHGQLGNGSTKDSQTPVQVSGLESGVSALVAMRHHACAITGLGNAWCWGSNKDRQIADSDESHLVPIKTFSGVRAIGGSNVNTCAITNSGSVVCRGPGYGISEKAFDQHSDVIALTHGPHERICALSSTGTVLCWDKYGVPTEKSGLSNITSVTAGGSHTCALESSGSVRCWGWNKFGQLGSGTNSDSVYPGYVSDLHSVKAIAAGYNSTCALVSSGSVKCWGHGEYGNLGPGHTVDKNVPVGVSAIGSGSWAIAGLQSHSCVITDKNVVKCWGWQYGYGGSGRNGRGYPHKVWTVAGFP